MKAPDKKYPLSVLDDLRASTLHFMSDKIYFDGIEYIRKDALLEWAKEKNQIIDTNEGDYSLGYVSAMIDLIDKLNSM